VRGGEQCAYSRRSLTSMADYLNSASCPHPLFAGGEFQQRLGFVAEHVGDQHGRELLDADVVDVHRLVV